MMYFTIAVYPSFRRDKRTGDLAAASSRSFWLVTEGENSVSKDDIASSSRAISSE